MVTVSDFAKLLGVEYGEEFKFGDEDGAYTSIYRLTKEGLECFNEYTNTWGGYDLGINFIFNKKISKKPWKPKTGDYFYAVNIHNAIVKDIWEDTTFDYAYYAIGNCFRTIEDAEKHKKEISYRLKSAYDNDRYEISKD